MTEHQRVLQRLNSIRRWLFNSDRIPIRTLTDWRLAETDDDERRNIAKSVKFRAMLDRWGC